MKNNSLLVLTSTFPTFAENDPTPPFVWNLTKSLSQKLQWDGQKNISFIVLAPRSRNSPVMMESKEGITILRFGYFFSHKLETLCEGGMIASIKTNPWRALQVPFFLSSFIYHACLVVKRHKVSCIHAHWIIPQGLVAYIVQMFSFRKISLVCTSHGWDVFFLNSKPFNYLKGIILKRSDLVAPVSSFLEEKIRSFCPDLQYSRIIPMWVDHDSLLTNSNHQKLSEASKFIGRRKVFLFVGRLVEKKGVLDLIETFSSILKFFPDSILLIVGTGPMHKRMKLLAEKLEITKSTLFLGDVGNSQIWEYYKLADYFISLNKVVSNDGDWIPTSFMEAAFFGLPIICSFFPGVDDFLNFLPENSFMIYEGDPQEIVNLKRLNGFEIEQLKNKFWIQRTAKEYLDAMWWLNLEFDHFQKEKWPHGGPRWEVRLYGKQHLLADVAVIIPCSSTDQFLVRSINSVLSQNTILRIQIVLIVNSKKCNYLLLSHINSLMNDQIKITIIVCDRNIGAGCARNIWVFYSCASCLAFLDHDDFWISRNKLQEQFNFLSENKEIKVVWTSTHKTISWKFTLLKWKNSTSLVTPLKKCPMHTSSMFTTKAFFEEVWLFSLWMKNYEDHDWILRAMLIWEIAIIDGLAICYFKREKSLTSIGILEKAFYKAALIVRFLKNSR